MLTWLSIATCRDLGVSVSLKTDSLPSILLGRSPYLGQDPVVSPESSHPWLYVYRETKDFEVDVEFLSWL